MSVDEEGGYIYLLYNPAFDKYGECYKIGQTRDIKSRINGYITSYPEKCEVRYCSSYLLNYKLIERAIHVLLKKNRINSKREFFTGKIKEIIKLIEEVCKYSKEDLIEVIKNQRLNIEIKYETEEEINKSSEERIKSFIYRTALKEIFSLKAKQKEYEKQFRKEKNEYEIKIENEKKEYYKYLQDKMKEYENEKNEQLKKITYQYHIELSLRNKEIERLKSIIKEHNKITPSVEEENNDSTQENFVKDNNTNI